MINMELLEKAKQYDAKHVLNLYDDYFGILYDDINIYLNWFIECKKEYSENHWITNLFNTYHKREYFHCIKNAELNIKDFNEYTNYLEERENVDGEYYSQINNYFKYLKNILILKKEGEELTYEEKYPRNLLTKQRIIEEKVLELLIKDNNKRWVIE